MDLQSFFNALKAGGLSNKTPVILLRGNSYPLLLCSVLLDQIKRIDDLQVESIDLQESDDAILASKCATTFLGQRSFYWLYNFTILESGAKKRMEQLLSNYQGPNCLMFFALAQSNIQCISPQATVVDIPDMCDKELFLALVLLSQGTVSETMQLFAHQLFGATQHIPLDCACIMIRYANLLGNHYAVFIKHWLGNLVRSEHSLFTLSQHLFAKNGKSFFAAWPGFLTEYSDVFWISFWSEQLWRATVYIRLMHNNDRVQAEKVGYRLPFSFKNKQWSRWDPAELAAAHSFLQSTDFVLKNGGTIFNVELFYAKFFANDFAAK